MKRLVCFALAICLMLGLCACGGGSKSSGTSSANTVLYMAGLVDSEKTIFLPHMDGTVTKLKGEYFRGRVTPDRKHAVTLEWDGKVSLVDLKTEEKTTIAENGDGLGPLTDEILLYQDADGEMHRYSFSAQEDTTLGKVDYYYCNFDNSDVVYATKGNVYLLKADSSEREKLGSYNREKIEIVSVSVDSSIVVWAEYDKNEEKIVLYTNGDHQTLGTARMSTYSTASHTSVSYDKNGKSAVVCNYYSDTLYMISAGKEPISVKLGNDLNSTVIYTKEGRLRRTAVSTLDGLYVLVDNGDSVTSKNLYYIDAKGEREKVIGNLTNVMISAGYLYYVDEDHNLYSAKLDKAALTDETKIAGDVTFVSDMLAGDYVYYYRDVEDSVGTVYVVKAGSDPQKVASDVYTGAISTSPDGKTLLYLKDIQKVGDTGTRYGMLYSYTIGGKEPVKIASDVVSSSLDSGVRYGVMPDFFTYERYNNQKDKNIEVDWFYWNGKEAVKLASDVIH